ncbi:U32 family peptidase [Bacteroidales bacterium OttesenSCG-928-A17]|nr:U32 family peptidase [Bacteroidales bacterium OttesenSCG-928-A17]
MKSVRKIELLAPAKNLETGIAAIDHGADAVYIGAPAFSARSAAGNSIEDIRKLIEYAHIFNAKVYIALNTILYDEELPEVEKWINRLYEIYADALIIQDMGILRMNIPPIPLHASTQCDNRDIEKIRFLEQAGFSQIVLARELNLDEIKGIAQEISVPLEVFIHGALCVSYSGQCYISEALSGRSANRGECAQYCRLPYTLRDRDGKMICANKHLLSLKDLNRSSHLESLLDAGVRSFKIEGRLKDISYVKNITAYYRNKLDAIFEKRPEYMRSSSGKTELFFHPNPAKSFNRGFTDYFLSGRKNDFISENTPKSVGEPIGNIVDLNRSSFTVSGNKIINNGDGLCFLNSKGELEGFRVNRVDGQTIFPHQMPILERGITLYRNHDHEFEQTLQKKSAERKINIDLKLDENNFGFSLTAEDEDSCSASITIPFAKDIAQKPQQENIRLQLTKLGNTPFEINQFTNALTRNWFIPSSVLSQARRQIVERLLSVRKMTFNRIYTKPIPTNKITFPKTSLDYRGNVSNQKAAAFYKECGVKDLQEAYEQKKGKGVSVMTNKYCIKYQLGYCAKINKKEQSPAEPFSLITGSKELQVVFDCRNCEMKVVLSE